MEQHLDLVHEFDPNAHLEDEWGELYVAPRRIGFYNWTVYTFYQQEVALYKCKAEACAQATCAQQQLTKVQEALAQAAKQYKEAHTRFKADQQTALEATECRAQNFKAEATAAQGHITRVEA